MESICNSKVFILVDINEKVFKEQAQVQEIKMKIIKQSLQKSFEDKIDFIKEVEPFYSKFYQIVISKLINNVLDVNLLKQQSIILDLYFSHRTNSISKLTNIWISRRFYIPTPFIFFGKLIFEGSHIIYNEIDSIHRYFGEKLTIHYAFVSFFTCHLLLLSFVGMFYSFFYIDKIFGSDKIFPIWGFIYCVWTMLILKLWIRKNREIVHKWGVTNISAVREVRDNYKGDEVFIGHHMKLEKNSFSNRNVIIC